LTSAEQKAVYCRYILNIKNERTNFHNKSTYQNTSFLKRSWEKSELHNFKFMQQNTSYLKRILEKSDLRNYAIYTTKALNEIQVSRKEAGKAQNKYKLLENRKAWKSVNYTTTQFTEKLGKV
jgi:hypothetical protein